MDAPLTLLGQNLLSPMLLAFCLGIAAQRLGSDLRLPDPVHQALTIYLLLAIGMKGGVALSVSPLSEVVLPLAGSLILGAAIPFWCYPVLRRFGRFEPADAAAVAAHYASVSAVTFVAGLAWLEGAKVPVEGFMPALLAVMEAPGIAVAVLLGRRAMGGEVGFGALAAEVLAGRSILLLIGGLVIGALTGERGYAPVAPFFASGFAGALTLFLLDMGVTAARRFGDLRRVGPFLLGFAIVAPLLNGVAGAFVGRAVGLGEGGIAMLAILSASASYIAAPAAVRLALPEANPAFALTAALAVTFPFNLSLGLPLYAALARAIAGGG
ncbi:sodium-dependent bicarbonate transport family permease [Elioraea rosea]|uniref:sodium-dependent bicarbonate transport family permease n=1 Tax=Elioraea rosea TaxID=2492390 RepID=UPI001182FF1E|nr:sodium-dependent bicarbonate transport family permease [Elioraea rosea]